MHKLVMIFLYPHSLAMKMVHYLLVLLNSKTRSCIVRSKWLPEDCIQCSQCSFVCPHATIRPILATEAEVAAAPEHFDTIPCIGR